MSKAPKHRKMKRATVLIKRSQCLRNKKSKSYAPLYQKLKLNNHSLARALSQEKQDNQMLFTKNLELIAEVQDIIHACNSRDLIIRNILKNSKEMLQMLVKFTTYFTTTISSCQEFVSKQGIREKENRASTNSPGRRESMKRLSTKSPARGVVKPMVSGHTITKPTINLSRVNMQRIQNTNLSIIEEIPSSPHQSMEMSDDTSPTSPSVNNYESRRSHLIQEAANIDETENARRLSIRNSRFSGRDSKRLSKRNSGRMSKHSGIHDERLKSPRVALQDVSRLLRNSQKINLRESILELTEAPADTTNHIENDCNEGDDTPSPDTSVNNASTPEMQDSSDTSDEEFSSGSTKEKKKKKKKSSSRKRASNSNSDPKPSKRSSTNPEWDDPMEGPSWLLSTAERYYSSEDDDDEEEEELRDRKSESPVNMRRSFSFRVPQLPSKPYRKQQIVPECNGGYNGIESHNENFIDDDATVNYARFVTTRRGHPPPGIIDEEDVDDFTLVLNMQKQVRPKVQPHFDITEFQLPTLKPLIEPVQVQEQENDDITAPVQITQKIHVQPPSNFPDLGESFFDTLTVKLPRITDGILENSLAPLTMPLTPERFSELQMKKRKVARIICSGEEDTPVKKVSKSKKKVKKTRNSDKSRDPSMAKVVLQKLNDSHVNKDASMSERRKTSEEPVNTSKGLPPSRNEQSSDSESSTASFNSYAVTRPRRQKAPKNLQEPSLSKKLRRGN